MKTSIRISFILFGIFFSNIGLSGSHGPSPDKTVSSALDEWAGRMQETPPLSSGADFSGLFDSLDDEQKAAALSEIEKKVSEGGEESEKWADLYAALTKLHDYNKASDEQLKEEGLKNKDQLKNSSGEKKPLFEAQERLRNQIADQRKQLATSKPQTPTSSLKSTELKPTGLKAFSGNGSGEGVSMYAFDGKVLYQDPDKRKTQDGQDIYHLRDNNGYFIGTFSGSQLGISQTKDGKLSYTPTKTGEAEAKGIIFDEKGLVGHERWKTKEGEYYHDGSAVNTIAKDGQITRAETVPQVIQTALRIPQSSEKTPAPAKEQPQIAPLITQALGVLQNPPASRESSRATPGLKPKFDGYLKTLNGANGQPELTETNLRTFFKSGDFVEGNSDKEAVSYKTRIDSLNHQQLLTLFHQFLSDGSGEMNYCPSCWAGAGGELRKLFPY